MIKNYYQILDIHPDTNPEEIKKAFRKKALKYHPDVCKLPNANNLFIEVYEAFEILSDSQNRLQYDKILFEQENAVVEVKKPTNDNNFNIWMNNAKTKAEKHSKMKYDEYKRSAFYEIFETTRKTISIGCIASFAIIWILGLYGFFVGLSQLLRQERDDYSFVMGLVLFILPTIPLIIALKNKFKKT